MIGERPNTRALPTQGRIRTPGLAWRAVAVLAVGIALAVPVARAGAESIGSLSDKIDAAQAKAEALSSDVETSVVALAAARSSAASAANREEALNVTLANGRDRAGELGTKVRDATARLNDARERLDRSLAILSDRLVAIYKSNEPDGVGVLLAADGFDDLSTRADLLARIQAADTALAERVRDLRRAVATELEIVERAKSRVDAHNARVEDARDEIAAARAAATDQAARLEQARVAQGSALEAIDSRVAGWTEQVSKLEEISAAEASDEVAGWSGGGFNGWAIPEAIVMCESGGNFSALNPSSGAGGAYQILPSTWDAYGGKGLPHQASPAEQHAIAAQIWADSGPSAWVCAA